MRVIQEAKLKSWQEYTEALTNDDRGVMKIFYKIVECNERDSRALQPETVSNIGEPVCESKLVLER